MRVLGVEPCEAHYVVNPTLTASNVAALWPPVEQLFHSEISSRNDRPLPTWRDGNDKDGKYLSMLKVRVGLGTEPICASKNNCRYRTLGPVIGTCRLTPTPFHPRTRHLEPKDFFAFPTKIPRKILRFGDAVSMVEKNSLQS